MCEMKRKIAFKLWFMNNRARPGEAYVPTDVEHIANCVTHGLWILPSWAGMIWMLLLATTSTHYVTGVIYGCSLISLFTVSTVFHTISYSGKCSRSLKNFFHIGDRAVIYIFIASSYTPWLTCMYAALGLTSGFQYFVQKTGLLLKDFHTNMNVQTLWVVWVAAVLGILYQYTFHEQYKWLETLLYIIIGVCPSIVIMAMKDGGGLTEVFIGGVIYICGVIFFKMDGIIPFAHAIWHCFVFVGATFHFCAVCKYLFGAEITPEILIS